jgi:serine/threonine protein kinase
MFKEGQEIGVYTLIDKVGEGGYGEVWLAVNRTLVGDIKVAIKLPISKQINLDATKKEAELWIKAKENSNILPIIDVHEYDGQVVIVSEFAPDGTLENLLSHKVDAQSNLIKSLETSRDLIKIEDNTNNDSTIRKCKLSEGKAVELAKGILNGLKFLHSKRIIHRDIKPANILMRGETPLLADFGISIILENTVDVTQVLKGTPSYMAPEAWDGKRNERTDLWSVGIVLY